MSGTAPARALKLPLPGGSGAAGFLLGTVAGVMSNSFTNQWLTAQNQRLIGGLLPILVGAAALYWLIAAFRVDAYLLATLPTVQRWSQSTGQYVQDRAAVFAGWIGFIGAAWWLSSHGNSLSIQLAGVGIAFILAAIYYGQRVDIASTLAAASMYQRPGDAPFGTPDNPWPKEVDLGEGPALVKRQSLVRDQNAEKKLAEFEERRVAWQWVIRVVAGVVVAGLVVTIAILALARQ